MTKLRIDQRKQAVVDFLHAFQGHKHSDDLKEAQRT